MIPFDTVCEHKLVFVELWLLNPHRDVPPFLKFTSGCEVFYEVKFHMQIAYNVNVVCVGSGSGCAYVWWATAFASLWASV